MELTDKEKIANYETMKHIRKVQSLMTFIIVKLQEKLLDHDESKMEYPERIIFCEYTEKLAGLTYGSDKYKKCLEEMGPALQHHYSINSHHPEHYKNGINDMNLIDIIEMFCDWYAASMRHIDGSISKSIEINKKRFNMDDQLVKILKNTVRIIGHE